MKYQVSTPPTPVTAADIGGAPGGAATRSELVDEAAAQWRDELATLGGRDPLLYFRDLKTGTLDLAAAEPEARKRLLDGEKVLISKLFPHEPLRSSALRSTRAIRDKGRELSEERGLTGCLLAVGIATWANPFAAHRPTAPVLLRTASVVARDPAETDFSIEVADDPVVNPVLLNALDVQLGLRFAADDLADPAGLLRYTTVVERLREFAPPHVVDGFSIAHRAVLATFAVEPLLLARDITAFGADLETHDVVAALAGDDRAGTAIGAVAEPVVPEFLAFDTDAEQDDVVSAIAAGGHLLVEGAPGSGRTQTVAAAVAELVGRGKRVLVVGQKRATLSDLVSRLDGAGLGDVVLDLSRTTPAEAVAQVTETARALAARPVRGRREADDSAAELGAQLDAYRDALHQPRQPWGTSAYEAMVAVASAPPHRRSEARIPVAALQRAESAGTLRSHLREYTDLEGLTLTEGGSPWHGSEVPTHQAADELLAAAVILLERAAPALRDAATRAAVEVGLAGPSTLEECLNTVELLGSVARTITMFGAEVWNEPLDELIAATGDRAQRSAQPDAPAGFLARRRSRSRVRELTGGSSAVDRAAAHDQLIAARDQLATWRERARDARPPRTGPHLPDAVEAAAAVESRLVLLARANPRTRDLATLSFGEAARKLKELVADESHLRAMPRLAELESAISAAGLDGLVAELRGRSLPSEQVEQLLDHVRHASLLDMWRTTDPALRDFDVAAHEKLIEEFRAADAAGVRATAGRVLEARAVHFARVAENHEGQVAVLVENAEHPGAAGQAAPRSTRELLDVAPDVALAAVPCWVTSPLAVAAALPSRRLFDVVIVEDAGRVAVAQAVPAIARGHRLVLVGDDEVASTSFTTAVDPSPDPDEQEGAWGEAPPPSVVDALRQQLAVRALTGQHRVRDDRLVGFAARSIYAGRLALVPGAAGTGRLTIELVDTPAGGDDPVDSSPAEVARVVDLVLEHMRTRPHESLGVVTLGPRHAERVDAALRRALVRAPEVAGYLHEGRAESFFVKDVERVAGDVRDAIVLSLGYGRSVDGRVLYRFGALGRPGGDRRLATATTRARERMTVVSTFGSDDLSPRRLTTAGAQALGEFLGYVERGAEVADDGDDRTYADPLAEAVAEKLRAAGASVILGHGGSDGVSVAVRHPGRRDRFVLAVETDGPEYASRGSARARDRLRPMQLTRLGWAVHQVWSAAWARDPDGEARRLVAAYEQAVADADAYDWAVAAAEADVVAGMPDDLAGSGKTGRARGGRQASRTTGGDTTAAAAKGGRAGKGGKARSGRPAEDGRIAADDSSAKGAGDGDTSTGIGDEAADVSSGGAGAAGTETGDAAGREGRGEAEAAPVRGEPRPPVPSSQAISDYTRRDLAAMARWIESDLVPRGELAVVRLLADELALSAADARTTDVLRHAVRVARAGAPPR